MRSTKWHGYVKTKWTPSNEVLQHMCDKRISLRSKHLIFFTVESVKNNKNTDFLEKIVNEAVSDGGAKPKPESLTITRQYGRA